MPNRPPPQRRFPPPWTVEVHDESMIVVDAKGHPLVYLYYDENSDRRMNNKRLTKDEARRIAINIARLPELLTIEKHARGDIPDET